MKYLISLGLFLISPLLFAQFSSGIFDSVKGLPQNTAELGDSPLLAQTNPASTALSQRITLDALYSLLIDDRNSNEYGHLAGLGISIPTNIGVFSTQLSYQNSALTAINLGSQGRINLNFSKDIYTDLSFGLGLNVIFGKNYLGTDDWGLGLNLGFIHKPENFLKDFTWGISIRDMGKGFAESGFNFPANFTPSIGAQFTVFEEEFLALRVGTDFSFPSFQNFVWQTGLSLNFVKAISLDVGYIFDTKNISNQVGNGLSLGLSARIGAADEAGNANSEFQPSLFAKGIDSHSWNFGVGIAVPLGVIDKNPPKAKFTFPDLSYFSPNEDGKQDNLSFALDIEDERYLSSFTLIVYNEEGLAIRTIRNKDQRPEADTIDSLFQRLVRVKKGVPIPNPVVWDGLDDKGAKIPDGKYVFTMEAIDDNGNIYNSGKISSIIDTKAPELKIGIPETNKELAFSPKGDRPILKLPLTSSSEKTWTIEIFDARDTKVREINFANELPKDLEWDGKDQNGSLASDGVYEIVLSSTDLAGNFSETSLKNILLINEPTPLGLVPDTNYFSPNNDQIKDETHIIVNANRNVKVLNFGVTLKDASGKIIFENNSLTEVPELISLVDPQAKIKHEAKQNELVISLRDKDDKLLAEGAYKLAVSALYINGNIPQAETPELVLDITPPKAIAKTSFPSFSPNGDGKKDSIIFDNDTSNEPEWEAIIWNPAGKEVSRTKYSQNIPQKTEWNGNLSDGTGALDGKNYKYQIVATDLAGNRGQSAPIVFDLDRQASKLTITTLTEAFSPNNDGSIDTASFGLSFEPKDGIESYVFSLESIKTGKIVYEQRGQNAPAQTLVWNGTQNTGKDAGILAPEGLYRAKIEAVWIKGDTVLAVSQNTDLDITPPSVQVQSGIPGLSFSPDNDGNLDILPVYQINSTEENLWTGVFKKQDNSIVKTLTWTGKAQSFEWDGRDTGATKVADGSYTYELSATDKAGNKSRTILGPIKLDTQKRELGLEALSRAFSPNGDGKKDSIGFKFNTNKAEGINAYTLEILTAQGSQSVQSKTGKNPITENLSWDGLIGGKRAPEGEYTARIAVSYQSGQNPQTISQKFMLITTIPQAQAYADFTTISPDSDGFKDKVLINQKASEGKLPVHWTGNLYDTNQKLIRTWNWSNSLSPSIEWDGTDSSSKIVPDGEYFYTILGSDEAENKSMSEGISVRVDKRVPILSLKPKQEAFSPNGDGVIDQIEFSSDTSISDGLNSWNFQIIDAKTSTIVKTIQRKGELSKTLNWDGKTDDGKLAPDAQYQANLKLDYVKGNQPQILSTSFMLDTQAPKAQLTPVVLLFSPEGDGFVDELLLKQDSSEEQVWTGNIFNAQKDLVKTFTWRGKTQILNWDGKTNAGIPAPDGDFSYTLSARDIAGNSFSISQNGITIDRRAVTIRLSAQSNGLNPRSTDKGANQITFNSFVDLAPGVKEWQLSIKTKEGSLVREIEASGKVPETLIWDGSLNPNAKGEKGPIAPDGKYIAILEARYKKGNIIQSQSQSFDLDTQGPVLLVKTNPNPFSPDDDGIEDNLLIGLSLSDQSEIRDWKLEIFDPENHLFVDWNGKGLPTKELTWNGKDRKNELVQSAEDYQVRLTATDILGNTSVISKIASVDVLVIRDGDLLRIRLPGIEFPSGSDNLRGVDQEKVSKNMRTLDRLAEILKKYSSYKITVEGHANSTNVGRGLKPDEKEQRDELLPLSAKRAESVRQYLIERGIARERLGATGVGGSRPLIDFGDSENRWKNRRVEFILKK